MNNVKGLINFLKESPSSYHAFYNVKKMIEQMNNYNKNNLKLKKGKCYYFYKESKNGGTLIAVNIGKNINKENFGFNIISSHADSPWFKISKEKDYKLDGYHLIPSKKYGGPILSTWYDKPLTIAGKVTLNKRKKKIDKLVYLKDKTFIIPNLCVHFNKFIKDTSIINNGNAFIGTKSSFIDLLSKELKVNRKEINSFSLNTIIKQEPFLWGDDEEFLSSQRLDDLSSVYASTISFINNKNPNKINVLYITDNEEIGSNTDVGAFDLFLKNTLTNICKNFDVKFEDAINKSFMISSDNAQGYNPYFGYVFNKKYKVFLNKGLAIKNSKKYSTTIETRKMMIDICKKAKSPYQIYFNRQGIKGGSTVGNIIKSIIKIDSVDVGMPQLSMHSTLETIGTFDIKNTIEVFDYFYGIYNK